MNVKNLLFIGLAAAVLFTGCKEGEDGTVSGTPKITLSETGPIEFGEEAGSKSLTLTASRDWFVEISSAVPDWITVKPESGPASDKPQQITIDVKVNEGVGRTAKIVFKAGLAEASLKVNQQGPGGAIDPDGITAVSVAEFLAADVNDGDDAPLYRLTGTLTYVASSRYGNVYIEDETGSVYAYGLCSDKSLTFESYGDIAGLTVGDLVTIVGKRGEHEGQDQVADGYYESHVDASVNPTLTESTLADFLNAEISYSQKDYYKLTGTITEIEDKTYGNIYIEDETGTKVLIYGVAENAEQIGNSATFQNIKGLNVGDIITVGVCRGEYKGSAQGVNGYYISHVDGENPGGDDEPVVENPWLMGNKSFTEEANVNGTTVPVLKLGTSSVSGSAKIVVPAGTKTMTFYAVSWNKNQSDLTFSGIEGVSPATVSPAANTGAADSSPYTITVTDSDKYTLTFAAATAEGAQLEVASAKRNILWGFEFSAE